MLETKMTMDQIKKLFEANQNESRKKQQDRFSFTKVYGCAISLLRELAKEIGYDDEVAEACSIDHSFEGIFLSCLITNPKTVSKQRLLELIKLSQNSSIMDQALASLIRTSPYLEDILTETFHHPELVYRCAFYQLFSMHCRQSELSKISLSMAKIALSTIQETIAQEPLICQNAMNNAVVMAGLHVPDLVDVALKVSDEIGYILPLKAKNSCNIQSAKDYLVRYLENPQFSRVARLLRVKDTN